MSATSNFSQQLQTAAKNSDYGTLQALLSNMPAQSSSTAVSLGSQIAALLAYLQNNATPSAPADPALLSVVVSLIAVLVSVIDVNVNAVVGNRNTENGNISLNINLADTQTSAQSATATSVQLQIRNPGRSSAPSRFTSPNPKNF